MGIVWNGELKKLAAGLTAILLAGICAVNLWVGIYGNQVRKEYNHMLACILGNVLSAYPDVSEEELVLTLSGQGGETLGRQVLAGYGIFESYGSSSFAVQEKQLWFLGGFSNIFTVSFFILFAVTVFFYLKRRQIKIRGLTDYMQEINRDRYRLDMEDNGDDELSGLRNEIYKLTVFLKEKADQAVERRQALADSVTNISHQLKTPLTSITVLLDNLSENPDMDKATRGHFLSELTCQVTGMSWLIGTMLKLSRLDAGVVELERARTGVNEMVQEVLTRLEMAAEWRQVCFRVNIPADAEIYADRKWTVEGLMNIVKNAVEHSPAGGTVEISGEENEVYTQIAVRDQGGGITREEQENLFRRFYKGSLAREDSVGIGLALAREIVEKQSGTISLDSRPGGGTVFRIRFLKQ